MYVIVLWMASLGGDHILQCNYNYLYCTAVYFFNVTKFTIEGVPGKEPQVTDKMLDSPSLLPCFSL